MLRAARTGAATSATAAAAAAFPLRARAAPRRLKSSHQPLPSRSSPSIFKPKPSLPHSVQSPDDIHSAPGPSTLPDSPPPKLVRYERQEDGTTGAWHHYPRPEPTSVIAKRTTAAGLFSIYPSTTRAAAAVKPVQEEDMAVTTRKRSSRSLKADKEKAAPAENGKGHSHGHSHGGIFHHHDHSHGHEHSAEEADQLLAALKGKGDRGANITLVGLASNVALCAAKGTGGVYLHSAALLADAAHSLSDLFADLVTLFCWKMSQRPPSETHPLGYGKFETMGSLGVSLVLVAGAIGIGFHSYGLLLEALQPTIQQAPSAFQMLSKFTGGVASVFGHSHGDHSHHHADAGAALDPNAMWFALVSIGVKEWLYWATLKIAREENSSVLEANALHHRSDSLSSGVTFLAIGASWLGFPVLDPLGGLLVAGLIGKQGADLLVGALAELSDVGVEPSVLKDFQAALETVQQEFPKLLVSWRDLRAVKSGVSTFVDVTLEMPPNTKLSDARQVEQHVREAITGALRGVKEVRVSLDTTSG